jgi:hypothetical protein
MVSMTIVLGNLLRAKETGLGPVAEIAVASLVSWVGITVIVTYGLLIGIGVGPAWFTAAAVILTISVWPLRPPWSEIEEVGAAIWHAIRDAWIMWVVVGSVVLVHVVLAAISVSTFGDTGWDASWYHLPIVGSMIQEGSLFGFPELNPWMAYPAFVEVQGTLIGTGLGSVRVVSLVQAGMWIWLMIFVAGFLSHRASKGAAVAATFAIAAIPSAWLQTRTMYEDVTFGVILAAAAVTAVLAFQHRHRLLLIASALLAGSLFAIKLGPAGAVPVVLVIAIIAFSSRDMRRSVVIVVVLGVLPAAPFLLRNSIEWGNPTYPLSLTKTTEESTIPPVDPPFSMTEMRYTTDDQQRPESLWGLETPEAVFTSLVVSPLGETARMITDRASDPSRYIYRYDAREGGYGTAWLALLAVSLVAAGVVLYKSPSARRPRTGKAVLAASLVAIGLLSLALTQAPWWPRYTLGAAFIIAIAAGLVAGNRRWSSIAALVIVIPIAALTVVATETEGGVPYWNDVVSADDQRLINATGLSVFTPPYAPLVIADSDSALVVGDAPNFPAGLWANDWRVDVEIVDVDDLNIDTECVDALLIDVAHLTPTQDWLDEVGATVHNVVAWDESGRQLAFLTGITCPAP